MNDRVNWSRYLFKGIAGLYLAGYLPGFSASESAHYSTGETSGQKTDAPGIIYPSERRESVAIPVDDTATKSRNYWPQWRGPLATGVAPDADPPIEWSETKNIRWKVRLPGKGHSTPIVWADRIFVTTAIPYGDVLAPRYSGVSGAHDNVPVDSRYDFVVLAINRRNGKILWERTVTKELPHEGGHHSGSLASNSPVTDGERLFVSFGSRGLYCLDLNGNHQWHANLGKMQTKHGHGEGSSPALYGDTLVVNYDHEGASFLVAFDKQNGHQRWKVERDEVTSWATPIIVNHNATPQVIVPGTKRLRGYDLASGAPIWECAGLSANIVASPVATDDMVFAGSSYVKRCMLAVRLAGARGDITGSDQVAWRRVKGAPYVPSLLLYDDYLYFLSHYQGILTRLKATTGQEQPGAFRLRGVQNVYASPVGAAGRVYITDLAGLTLVISHDSNPKPLAENQLDSTFSASAAIVDRELFLRGDDFLYCIAEE